MLAYNKVTLYGGSLVDYLWIKNNVDSQTIIDSTTGYYFSPTWEGETILLAPFTENINGGNIVSLSDEVIYWQIYRTTPDSNVLEFVAKVPAFQSRLSDYGVANNNTYSYTIFAETENYISAPMPMVNSIITNWDSWSIVALSESETSGLYYTQGNTWIFNSNLESGSFMQNVDKYTFETFTQFPKVSSGQRDYISTNVSALLGNIDPQTGEYVNDNSILIESFKNFISSGDLKLLKDRKGNAFICETTSNSFEIDDNSVEQITTVNFDVIQVNSIQDVSVIGA